MPSGHRFEGFKHFPANRCSTNKISVVNANIFAVVCPEDKKNIISIAACSMIDRDYP